MIFNKDKSCGWEDRVPGSSCLAEMDLGVLEDSRLRMTPVMCPHSKRKQNKRENKRKKKRKSILDCGSWNTARKSMSLCSGRIRPYPAAMIRLEPLRKRHSSDGMSSKQAIEMVRARALAWRLVCH